MQSEYTGKQTVNGKGHSQYKEQHKNQYQLQTIKRLIS